MEIPTRKMRNGGRYRIDFWGIGKVADLGVVKLFFFRIPIKQKHNT